MYRWQRHVLAECASNQQPRTRSKGSSTAAQGAQGWAVGLPRFARGQALGRGWAHRKVPRLGAGLMEYSRPSMRVNSTCGSGGGVGGCLVSAEGSGVDRSTRVRVGMELRSHRACFMRSQPGLQGAPLSRMCYPPWRRPGAPRPETRARMSAGW